MGEKIKVLVVDDNESVEKSIAELLAFHPEITAIGGASTAQEAIEKVKSLRPDVVLMDINMPGMDGITAAGIITTEVPTTSVIMMSVQGEAEYMRSSMLAGARNYLTKPFAGEELCKAILQVYANEQKRREKVNLCEKKPARGKIITVFSTKGGIGKTTIATNLATALPLKTGARVAIMDMDLQFGDVALFLNVIPRATIAELVQNIEHLDVQLLDDYMDKSGEKLKVLAAPRRPQEAEPITGSHITAILKSLRQSFDYIIVDTAPSFQETILAVLDASDEVLVVSTTDLPTIKNVKIGIEILQELGYKEDRIKLVLNRFDSESGIERREVEQILNHTFCATLPSDGKVVVASVNRGIPFVLSHPDAPVSQGIFHLAQLIAADDWDPVVKPKAGLVTKFKRLFG